MSGFEAFWGGEGDAHHHLCVSFSHLFCGVLVPRERQKGWRGAERGGAGRRAAGARPPAVKNERAWAWCRSKVPRETQPGSHVLASAFLPSLVASQPTQNLPHPRGGRDRRTCRPCAGPEQNAAARAPLFARVAAARADRRQGA